MDNRILADNNHNGHDDKERIGATIPIENLDREDGILARAALSGNRNNSGVLHTLITAIIDTKDYRQELKTANFSSPRKALQAVKAIHSFKACGVPEDEIIDAILALKAGVNMAFVHEILEALTHTTFTTNYRQEGKNKNAGSKSNSPIT